MVEVIPRSLGMILSVILWLSETLFKLNFQFKINNFHRKTKLTGKYWQMLQKWEVTLMKVTVGSIILILQVSWKIQTQQNINILICTDT